jgi:large subunit ribosomal protein L6
MSRVANNPVKLPKGVDITIHGYEVTVKGPKGSLRHNLPENVKIMQAEDVLTLDYDAENASANMSAGTTRALLNNMVQGVHEGFQRKLELVGVGYRAQVKGSVLSLTLGFSHPVDFPIEEGITIETPSQTEIIIKGAEKQKVGQVAAKIRKYRKPEPYKGKGIKYSDEKIIRKEAKKK